VGQGAGLREADELALRVLAGHALMQSQDAKVKADLGDALMQMNPESQYMPERRRTIFTG